MPQMRLMNKNHLSLRSQMVEPWHHKILSFGLISRKIRDLQYRDKDPHLVLVVLSIQLA